MSDLAWQGLDCRVLERWPSGGIDVGCAPGAMNHGTGWAGLEGTFKDHIVNPLGSAEECSIIESNRL